MSYYFIHSFSYNNLSRILAFLVFPLPHFGQHGRFGPALMPPSVLKASNRWPHCLHLNVALPLKCSMLLCFRLLVMFTQKREPRADILQRRS